MTGVRAPWPESLLEREGSGERGEGQGRRSWLAWREGTRESAWGRATRVVLFLGLSVFLRKKERGKREKKEEKRKGREKRKEREKYGKFCKLKICREKNK
jgi:hypothetical protein